MVELPSGETITHNTDIVAFLDSTLSDTNVRIPTEFPFDFTGGYVGYLVSYELIPISRTCRRQIFPASQSAQGLFSGPHLLPWYLESSSIWSLCMHSDPYGCPELVRVSTRRSTKVCAVNALRLRKLRFAAQSQRKKYLLTKAGDGHCTV